MPNKNKWRLPNAYKHGIFSRTTIVPGEDPEEFQTLYSDLIREWAPAGATEEDAVLSIAKAIWRKDRAQKFLEVQVTKNFLDPSHPSYDKDLALISLAAVLRVSPDVGFEVYASHFLQADKVKYLTHKFPRSNFKSPQEWAEALINEIKFKLPPEFDPMAKLGWLASAAATFTDDFFENEVRLDERLDIMIDRAVKRLIQIKAMKQMLGQTSAERVENQVRKIGVKKAANG